MSAPSERHSRRTRLRAVAWCVGSFVILHGGPMEAGGNDSPASIHRDRVLRLARSNDPRSLDPTRASLTVDITLLPLVHLPLLDVVGGRTLTKGAASNWSISREGTILTFTLDPKVRFSNGRRATAADYKYALERALDPTTGVYFADIYLTAIGGAKGFLAARQQESTNVFRRAGRWIEPVHLTGIEAEDPDTLVIHLDHPDATLVYMLANQFGMPVAREEVERPGAKNDTRPVGTGAYMVQEWVRGIRIVLGPNPCYAGSEPRHFERIEIMLGGDPSTHVMMFEKGELDIAAIEVPLPLPDYYRLSRSSRWGSCFETARIPAARYIFLNTQMAPLDNRKVRQALNYAVDKARRLNCADGRWEAARGFVPPFMSAYNSNLVGYPYNPEKARALLAESGVARPIKLTMWHEPNPEDSFVAQGIQDDLRAVGVLAELRAVTLAEAEFAASHSNTVQMASWGYTSPLVEPKDLLFYAGYGRNNTPNFSFYSNSEVDRLLELAVTNVIEAPRRAMYRRAEEIIVDDAPAIFLGHPFATVLKQPWLKGPLIEPLWPRRYDRVWIER